MDRIAADQEARNAPACAGQMADGITRGMAAEMIGEIKGQEDWPLGPTKPG